MPLTTMYGLHLEFPQLVAASPFASQQDGENYLARLKGFPALVTQVSAIRLGTNCLDYCLYE